MAKQKCICLFGGTFDPIHKGHTHIAEIARRQLDLDQVIFLPCRQSPHKSGQQHAGNHHRLTMCQLATDKMTEVLVDDHDLITTEPCYSWRTVEFFQRNQPGARIFWLMGSDQWNTLPQWSRSEYLSDIVEFIVFTRGVTPEPRNGYRMHSISGNHPASATAIRHAIGENIPNSIKKWLDSDVWDYIQSKQLYQNPQVL